MIIKTYPNRNLYGKYFLATEAPEDEEVTEEQPKPKRNVKVIAVKRSNRGKDFAQIDDEPIEEPVPEETPDPVEPTETTEPDTTDFTADADVGEETTPVENNEETPVEEVTPVEPTGTTTDDSTDFTADADTGEETTPVENNEETPATEEAPETIDVSAEDSGEDNTDFAADADTGEEAAPTEETPPAEDANATATNNNAPGVDLDSMRKYNLFKEFMSLYNACDNYISKLETVLKNDYEENQIIRISVNNLREIRDILSDYMTIRFRLNSYIQSLLFHQKMVAAVQLIFNMLRATKSNNSKTK